MALRGVGPHDDDPGTERKTRDVGPNDDDPGEEQGSDKLMVLCTTHFHVQ